MGTLFWGYVGLTICAGVLQVPWTEKVIHGIHTPCYFVQVIRFSSWIGGVGKVLVLVFSVGKGSIG